MERVRNVFVLPFHRIRRRTIFHALVLSPLRANDVRVTRGETQGLVFASKEDDDASASASASSSSRVYEESIYRRDRVQRCFLQRQTYPVHRQRFATRRGRQMDRARRRRLGGERRGGDLFRQRAIQLLLSISRPVKSIGEKNWTQFWCHDIILRDFSSAFVSMKNGDDDGDKEVFSNRLPRFLLLSDAFRDRHPFPFVEAIALCLRENDDCSPLASARNHPREEGKETSDDDDDDDDDDVGDKAGHDRVLAYDEQFLRRLDTLENRARRLRLFPQDTKDDDDGDDDDFTIESVKKHVLKGCALNEESSLEEENVFRGAFQTTLGGASTSSLWASEEAFAKDAEKMERLILKHGTMRKKTAKRKKRRTENNGMDVAIVKVSGERVFARHAKRSFRKLEERDGNIDWAFGKQRLRKLYGRVLKSEHKEGMVDVCIDRVQNYGEEEEEEGDDDDTVVSDENAEVVVGCVDASSTGLDVNFEDTPEFRNDVRLLVDANDAVHGNRHPFVFVQLDSLVSSFGSECRFECYDAKSNDFAPLDFEVL